MYKSVFINNYYIQMAQLYICFYICYWLLQLCHVIGWAYCPSDIHLCGYYEIMDFVLLSMSYNNTTIFIILSNTSALFIFGSRLCIVLLYSIVVELGNPSAICIDLTCKRARFMSALALKNVFIVLFTNLMHVSA